MEWAKKTCKKCGETKEIFHFNKSNSNVDGKTGTCRDCIKKNHKPSEYELLRKSVTNTGVNPWAKPKWKKPPSSTF